MPWSAAFIRALDSRTVAPFFVLRTSRGFGDEIPGDWSFASNPLVGGSQIATNGVRVTGSELNPLDWTCSYGGFEVDIVTLWPESLLPIIKRGRPVELLMGFLGVCPEERIAIGVVRNVRGYGGRYTIVCRDILGVLATRMTTDETKLGLFHDLAAVSTTLTAGYTPAAATITVASSAGFPRQEDGTGALRGAVLVGAATPFILTWTALTGTSFTVSAAGAFGTTAMTAASGSTITPLALVDDHPIDMVARVLTSTGVAAANGAWDTLPAAWGFAIPVGHLDLEDMERWRLLSQPASGADDWDFVAESVQTDGLSWLQAVLQPGGFFVLPRQGAFTCRAIVPPENSRNEDTITDDDIERGGVEEWSAYDEAWSDEIGSVNILSTGLIITNPENVATLPARETVDIDLTPFLWANASAISSEVLARLSDFHQRIPETVVVRCIGRRLANLTPGDRVTLTTSLLSGRMESTRGGYVRRECMVLGVDPDLWAGRVRVRLLVLPTIDEDI